MTHPNSGSGEPKFDPISEIIDLREAGEDGGDLMGFYCRGHVSRWDFAEACNKQSGATTSYDIRHVRSDECHHAWWRTVPITGQSGCSQFVAADPGTRGAWKATVWEGVSRRNLYGLRDYVGADRAGHRRGFAEGVQWALNVFDNQHRDAGEFLLKVWRARGEHAEARSLDRGVAQ